MGRIAVRKLFENVNGITKKPSQTAILTELAIRDSTGPLKRWIVQKIQDPKSYRVLSDKKGAKNKAGGR